MTLDELNTLLASTGMPVAYYAFPVGDAPPLPWICYVVTGSSNFIADGRVYQKSNAIDVELYCNEKDPALEARVEAVLADACIPWEKTEQYLDSEKCWEIIYEIEV